MPYAYHGRWLHVRLHPLEATPCRLPEDVLRRFVGGVGLGTWLLLHLEAWQHEALEAEAPLALVFSPLVGSPLTTSAKFAVVSRSPLTGRINDSLSSSHFALAGKRTGYDALVLTGQAPELSILVIDSAGTRLMPAEELAGLSCRETQQRLRALLGPEYALAVIGPAGEAQVPFATMSNEGRHAGRGGAGAVLGAKRIKAVAVAGSQRVAWAHPRQMADLARKLAARSLGPETAKYRQLGTLANVSVFNRLEVLPARNFQQSSFAGAGRLSVERLRQQEHPHQRESCHACTIGCEHRYLPPGQEQSVRLEYETVYALGALCGVDDPRAVLQAAQACDQLGLDTISTGATVAFAMECVQRGWLNEPWLQFGSGEAVLRAIGLLVQRRGVGRLLALGTRGMAQQLGPQALAIAPQVKGLELPGYDPRRLRAMALALAVNARGADHNRSSAYEVDFSPQARLPDPLLVQEAVAREDRAAVLDSLILCKFLRGVFRDFYAEAAELLWAATGWAVSASQLRNTARRIVTARKLFNIRCGWTPEEDTLPERLLSEPPSKGHHSPQLGRKQLDFLRQLYYQQRGWTPEGWIPLEQLQALQLADYGCCIGAEP